MFESGFVIGFITALGFIVAICWLIGAARIARVSQALAGGRRRASKGAVQNPVQADVQAALVKMGARAGAARRAIHTAAQTAPQEFEPLFRTALATLRKAA